MNKATDEQIISALLAQGTIKNAAAVLDIGERTIYGRMQSAEFRAMYRAVKADLLRQAVVTLNDRLQAAIQTTAEIMGDPAVNPAIRLQAAQTILTHAGRFTDRLSKSEGEFVQENATARDEEFIDIL